MRGCTGTTSSLLSGEAQQPTRTAEIEEDQAEAEAFVADVVGAPGAAAAAQAADAEGSVPGGEQDLQQLRKKCKNNLFLAGSITSNERVAQLARMHFAVMEPVFTAHSENARVQRPPLESLNYYLEQSQGAFMDILRRTAQVLEDPDKLMLCGLHVDKGVLPPVEVLKQNTNFLQEQDAMARQCFSLTTALIHTRLMSQAWHSDGWPGMLVLFASPEPSDKQRALDQL